MKKIFESKKNVTIGVIVLAILAIGFAIYSFVTKHNVFVRVGDLNYARAAHTATLLNDGRVLIIGGSVAPYRTKRKATILEQFDKVEVYLPNEKKFKVINQLSDNRVAHTATLLNDGNVLIAGGTGTTGEKIYDVKNNKFINVGSLNTKRYGHSALLLDDGNVLIVGGAPVEKFTAVQNPGLVKEIEIYNTKTRKFNVVSKISYNYNDMSITLKTFNLNKLTDGRILITPVTYIPPVALHRKKDTSSYNYSLIYDYKNNSLETLPNFGDTCYYNKTFVTKDGNIYNICSVYFNSTVIEKYDLNNQSNTVLADLKKPRYDFSAVLTNNNSILIFGGRRGIPMVLDPLSTFEKYDVKNNKVSILPNCWIHRKNFTTTILQNNKILITGGKTKDGKTLKLAQEY